MSKVAYLVMVEAGKNNNKYYRMTENGNSFNVEFGRIGSSSQKTSYPMSKWNTKFNEKIRKGYTDQTHLFAIEVTKEKDKYEEISDSIIKEIVDRLQRMAKNAISENYTISSSKVTQAMIDEASSKILLLSGTEDVEEFNKYLMDLFRVIPRKMSKVSNYLVKSKDEMERILENEQDLLDVMRGQVVQNDIENKNEEEVEKINKTILDIMGIKIEKISKKDESIIKDNLEHSKDKYYNAWKVTNLKTQEKFNKFVKEENISNIKLLWHGSRNENWWNIMNTGLVLRPNAIITGKMFGHGIYFAPKAQKSIGYTSLSGSYWASGSSNSAFMSLYEVAYGNPYNVYSFDSKYYDFNYDKLQNNSKGSHCLHAHSGNMLRNDEIIVYKEAQLTIKYLVEIK